MTKIIPLFSREDLRVYLSKADKFYPEPDAFLKEEPFYKEDGAFGLPAKLLGKHVYVQLTKWKEEGALNEHIYYIYLTKEEVLTAGYKFGNNRYYIPKEILEKRIVKLKPYMMPSKVKKTPKIPTMEELDKKIVQPKIVEPIEEPKDEKHILINGLVKIIKGVTSKDKFVINNNNGEGYIVDINTLSMESIPVIV